MITTFSSNVRIEKRNTKLVIQVKPDDRFDWSDYWETDEMSNGNAYIETRQLALSLVRKYHEARSF
jgi:hypothetical protein